MAGLGYEGRENIVAAFADTHNDMILSLVFVLLAAAFFWAGFLCRRHPLQHHSQAGFAMMLVLAGVAGYFAWREARTIGELAQRIDPVPEITDVTYIPSAAEMGGMARVLATIPGSGRFGSTQAQRRDFAERVEQRKTDYWLIKTALSPEDVFAFYRVSAPHRGWTIETDEPPTLLLARDAEHLALFVTDGFPGSGAEILYGLSINGR